MLTSGPAGGPSKGSNFKREEGRDQRGKCRRRHVYHIRRARAASTYRDKGVERVERREKQGMKETSFIKKKESRKAMVRSQTGGMVEKRVSP